MLTLEDLLSKVGLHEKKTLFEQEQIDMESLVSCCKIVTRNISYIQVDKYYCKAFFQNKIVKDRQHLRGQTISTSLKNNLKCVKIIHLCIL